MWPDSRFTELIGVDHPIIQAPMAGACTPALAAAVCDAGGLGSLGLGPRSYDFSADRVQALHAMTNRPFNLNFFAHATPEKGQLASSQARDSLAADYEKLGLGTPPIVPTDGPGGFGTEQLKLLLELRPAVATFHFGLPESKYIAALLKAGITLGATATSTAEAHAVEAAGCHFVVAQGFEAGGHRGSHQPTQPDCGVGTMALIPQVSDAVSIPVIAAGGIANGRGIVAALALGAAGVQIGTAFLRCPEAETSQATRKQMATSTDTDTVVTLAISGRASRVAESPFIKRVHAVADTYLPYPLQYGLSGPLQAAGGEDYAAHQYGQAAALAREEPARNVLERLVTETAEALSFLGGFDMEKGSN